ncbi:MAG: hypothetical protein PUH87_09750, partial [Bacteroidales bacterium]|nr:hypothetical protein [Bacteroidales bacterium]MDY5448627.1 hypothetical protein [Prevotella sp.]
NRLEVLLSVFDQTRKDKHNRQVMNIDESEYEDDAEMMHIIHRLLAAAADAKLRQDMNVEDEYFLAIENRDTAIMQRDKLIKEQDKQLAEQDKQIAEQDKQIADQDKQIAEQDKQIAKKNKQIADQGEQLANKDDIIISSAKIMKKNGMSIEEIAAITKLSEDEIHNL